MRIICARWQHRDRDRPDRNRQHEFGNPLLLQQPRLLARTDLCPQDFPDLRRAGYREHVVCRGEQLCRRYDPDRGPDATSPIRNYSILLSNNTTISSPAGSNFIISGPGTFDLIAGRNLNLEPSVSEDSPPLAGTLTNPYPNTALSGQYTGTSGVQAVGDGINPWLPQESAQLNILFGVSPGIDYKGFIADYLSPTTAGASAATYDPLLVSYVQGVQGQSTAPTVAAALATFDALPTQTQLPLLQEILFDEIRIVSEPTLPNGQTNSQYQDFARGLCRGECAVPGVVWL